MPKLFLQSRLLFALFSLSALLWTSLEARAERPNVLVIYSDDQGTIDAGCYGSDDLTTPAIDHLAETGIRFTQMYAPSCICSASRAGLLTGRLPVRAGVPANVSSKKGAEGMPASEVTLGDVFKQAGYRTAHVGKWHLGYTPATMPLGQGFDSSFGHMGGCIDNYSHFFYWNGPNRHDLWRDGKEVFHDGQFFPDLLVDEMQRLLTEKSEQPLFVYWAINVPHYPYQGTDKWRKHYADLGTPRREYAAFVSTLDEKLGEVLATLEETGQRENTIVVFQSDHGHSTEERAFFGGGSAGPYRGAKGCLFEGGIRVPSVISWPAGLPQGEVRDQMAVGCDWLPTLVELTKAEVDLPLLDGKDLSAVLKDADAPSPHDSFYWQMGGNAKNAQWAVRKGDWKLLGNCRDTSQAAPLTNEDKRAFLVNLRDDEGERKNLANSRQDVVQELQQIRQEVLGTLE